MYLSALGRAHSPVNSFERCESLFQDVQSLPDEELLRLCARNENPALEELVRRYQSPLTRLLTRLLSNPADVEEALLSVFLRAWQYAPRFQYRARVSTWLYRIAVNIATDVQKRRKQQPQQSWSQQVENAFPQSNIEEEALRRLEREAQAQALQRALNRLHPTDRLLLILYYYEQMEYEEIQAITQLSYTVLKTRLTRARRRLRQLLEAEDQEVGQ
ncbi:MAG TPA: sigma-70 family RNA polymerase sigma factor [Chthonomonadaceae bacterium]|nr:sigma-70 family RNA polymerase sigma factor [Chthonomonadaceae bacterium]